MVPFPDVGVDELAQRPKGSSPDGLSSDDAKPDLHLVGPETADWGEVEGDVRVFGEPLIDVGSGMCGQVVEGYVDRLAVLGGDHLIHELEKSLGATTSKASAYDFAGGGVQRREQVCGFVAGVVMGRFSVL